MHTLTQIPQPIHNSSEIKAILDAGVTSIQSFPGSYTKVSENISIRSKMYFTRINFALKGKWNIKDDENKSQQNIRQDSSNWQNFAHTSINCVHDNWKTPLFDGRISHNLGQQQANHNTCNVLLIKLYICYALAFCSPQKTKSHKKHIKLCIPNIIFTCEWIFEICQVVDNKKQ